MKRKLPAFRRVPVNFGNEEPLCAVPVQDSRFPSACARRHANGIARRSARFNVSTFQRFNARLSAFTLVEILVVLVLLSMIVLALMTVFSGIQRAFRASITQTDTLEGGRAAMDMIANDLATMTPSYGVSNIAYISASSGVTLQNNLNYPPTPINFAATLAAFSSPPSPLVQPLLSSPTGVMRTDILENVFILSKANLNGVPSWVGTGYSVSSNLPDGTLYPLYRFSMATNAASGAPGLYGLYTNFTALNYTNGAQWSHLMDGVVDLTARAYDTNGVWITNGYTFPQSTYVQNVFSLGSTFVGVSQSWFCSNAVPASVEIEMGTLEDHVLTHAESLGGANQSNYLGNSIGQLHIFRQRVWIPNVDLSAYQ
jgi:type II secretory pathway pseudopilin PulG